MNNLQQVLVFDMDNTIADLEGVPNWIYKLRTEDVSPYQEAKPIYDMKMLRKVLLALKKLGFRIEVVSWRSKYESKEYAQAVEKAKLEWLNRYQFPYDDAHIVPYGYQKDKCTQHLKGHQILIDDNPKVRESWSLGSTIDATKNIVPILIALFNIFSSKGVKIKI